MPNALEILGDKPLIVLARGRNLTPGWNTLQKEQTHLSSRSRQIIVSDSDDIIPIERPDAVVNAVQEAFRAAKFE